MNNAFRELPRKISIMYTLAQEQCKYLNSAYMIELKKNRCDVYKYIYIDGNGSVLFIYEQTYLLTYIKIQIEISFLHMAKWTQNSED